MTIDIGANNVDACTIGAPLTDPCIATGIAQMNADIPTIINALRAITPKLAIYGLGYYEPFLYNWLLGNQTTAQESVTGVLALNALLKQIYAANGVSLADPSAAWQTTDFNLTGSYGGVTEPQNVANVCNWTHACFGDAHPNDTGYAVLATVLEQTLDGVSVDTTTPLPVATIKTAYAGSLAAYGGRPKYLWHLAPGSAQLPPGLRLRANGTFGGKPTLAGTYTFTVDVTDAKLGIPSAPPIDSAQGTVSITVS